MLGTGQKQLTVNEPIFSFNNNERKMEETVNRKNLI